jgi:hypothetical protein
MKKPNGLLIEQNVRTRLEPSSVMVFLVWCLFTLGMAASRLRQLPFCGSLDDGFRGLSTGTVLLLPDFVIVGVLSGGVAAIAFATMSNLD